MTGRKGELFGEYTSARLEAGTHTEQAWAKVNLFLLVGPCRDDGYHSVATVMQTVALHDTITMTWQGVGFRETYVPPEVRVTSDDPTVPTDSRNLVAVAVQRLEPVLRRRSIGGGVLRIHITKRIPVAAGLAGGSSDAAAVLRGLNRSWDLGLSHEELEAIAAEIGSDVPACLRGGTLFCQGRGEKLGSLTSGTLWWVLASAGGTLGAGEVYRALDAHFPHALRGNEIYGSLEDVAPGIGQALEQADPHRVAPFLVNDLQQPAGLLDSRATALVECMREAGAIAALVCGSGPTVAALVSGADEARRLARRMQREASWVWWGPSVNPGFADRPEAAHAFGSATDPNRDEASR